MKQRIVATSTLFLFFTALLAVLPSKSEANNPGWTELSNTKIQNVCPPNTAEYEFSNYCDGVVNAWSGAAYDTTRNRLIIWGGGHNDYYGNEVYALDPNAGTMTRLNDPSTGFTFGGTCVNSLSDGRPVSRHTYGNLAYIAHADRFFAYGGSRACGSGGFGTDTWTLNLSTLQWENRNPSGNSPGPFILASAYDPITKKVYVRNVQNFFSYHYDSNTWQKLGQDHVISGFSNSSAVIDPVNRKFVVVGPGGVHLIDLDSGNYTPQQLATTGPDTIVQDGRSPGLAYDSVRNLVVAWDGSDLGTTPETVYNLNINTGQWTAMTATGGPSGFDTAGTFGRWQFVPNLNAFVVVNNVDENAYLFRADTTLIDTNPPSVSLTAPSNGATISGNTTLTATASDDNGIAAVTFLVDGLVINSEDTTPPYSTVFNTNTFLNGSHTIHATARDVGGNTTASSTINVTIDNEEPPPPPTGGALNIPDRTWIARNPPGPSSRAPTSKGKHTRMTWNPVDGLIYSLGGDHGGTAGAGFGDSGRQEAYTYDVVTEDWREINAYCRPDQGPQPMGPDEVGFPYDTTRNVFWQIPGFGHNHGQVCTGNNLHREKMMMFDPTTKQWVQEPAFPNFNRKLITTIAGGSPGNHRYHVYDEASDSIVSVRLGRGYHYHIPTDTWTRTGLFPNSMGDQIQSDEILAHDTVNRVLYIVENRVRARLFKYNIGPRTLEDLGPLPSSAVRDRESHAHWDSTNQVVLWPLWTQEESPTNDNEILTLYVYHPDTSQWESIPIVQPTSCPSGLDCTVRGRHSIYDPGNNVLVVMRPKGGGQILGEAPIFLFRYGGGSGSPPGDTTPPVAPKNLQVQ